jgi:hypothetical protein
MKMMTLNSETTPTLFSRKIPNEQDVSVMSDGLWVMKNEHFEQAFSTRLVLCSSCNLRQYCPTIADLSVKKWVGQGREGSGRGTSSEVDEREWGNGPDTIRPV